MRANSEAARSSACWFGRISSAEPAPQSPAHAGRTVRRCGGGCPVPSGDFGLDRVEEDLGLESWLRVKPAPDQRPDLDKRGGPAAVAASGLELPGQLAERPIFACRCLVDDRRRGRFGRAQTVVERSQQEPHVSRRLDDRQRWFRWNDVTRNLGGGRSGGPMPCIGVRYVPNSSTSSRCGSTGLPDPF